MNFYTPPKLELTRAVHRYLEEVILENKRKECATLLYDFVRWLKKHEDDTEVLR